MRENSLLRANRAMIADETHTIKASIKPFHHIEGLMLACNQCGLPSKVLWMQIPHIMM